MTIIKDYTIARNSVKLCGVKPLYLSAAILAAAIVPLSCANAPADKPATVALEKPKVAPTKPTFTSEEFGFALYLPSEPEKQQQPMPAEMGQGTVDSFIIRPNPVTYTVVTMKLPSSAVGLKESKFFDGVEEGMMQSTQGARLKSEDIEINGRNLRAFESTFSTPTADSKTPVKFIVQAHIYRAGERNYQFMAIIPESERAANQAEIDKVLNSVVITN